ncbi:MAG: response regulator [Enterocloster clostridioformis]
MDLNILVVDDDQVICESTCILLSELGMKGEWVVSGRAAVDQVELRYNSGEGYFAVLLDWKMPDMDGIATAGNPQACETIMCPSSLYPL